MIFLHLHKSKFKMIRIIIAIIIGFIFSGKVYSQENNVQISTNKVIIEGKQFYLHAVQKGETLYGIGKAYNLDVKDIAIENPDIFDGIKPEMILKVPLIKGINSNKEEILAAGKYIVHRVEKGETVYAISRKYNIKPKEIIELNPDIKDGIKADQLIRIPNQEKEIEKALEKKDDRKDKDKTQDIIAPKTIDNYKITDKDTSDFIFYEVKKKETLYSISKQFNTDILSILKHNPEVEKDGLKDGQLIKIPKYQVEEYDAQIIENKHESDKSPDTSKVYNIVKNVFSSDCDSTKNKKNIVVAVMLPFHTDKNIYLDVEKITKEEAGFYPNSSIIEFYEGILLSLDTLRKLGISISLNTFDTKNDSTTLVKCLQKISSLNPDFVIGPAYAQHLDIVSNFEFKNKPVIISPMIYNKEFSEKYSKSILIIPDNNTQMDIMSSHIIEKYKNGNVLLISNEKKEEIEIIKNFKKNADIDTVNKFIYKDINYKTAGLAAIEQSLRTDKENILFIPSSDQAFVTDLLTKLSLKTKKYPITVFGLPVWRKYDNIELDYLHRLNFHTYTNAFVDYNDDDVLKFIREYRFMFKNEPSNPFSYLGYDIMKFFTLEIYKYGYDFYNCLDNNNSNTLLDNFNFIKSNKTGYKNFSTFIIKYDNECNIIKVN